MQAYSRLKKQGCINLLCRRLGGKTGERYCPGGVIPLRGDDLKSWQDLFSPNACKGGKLGCRVLRKGLGERNPTHIVNNLLSGFRDKKKGDEEVDRQVRSSEFLHFKKDKETFDHV